MFKRLLLLAAVVLLSGCNPKIQNQIDKMKDLFKSKPSMYSRSCGYFEKIEDNLADGEDMENFIKPMARYPGNPIDRFGCTYKLLKDCQVKAVLVSPDGKSQVLSNARKEKNGKDDYYYQRFYSTSGYEGVHYLKIYCNDNLEIDQKFDFYR